VSETDATDSGISATSAGAEVQVDLADDAPLLGSIGGGPEHTPAMQRCGCCCSCRGCCSKCANNGWRWTGAAAASRPPVGMLLAWETGVEGREGHGERLRIGRFCAITMGTGPANVRPLPSGCSWLSDDRDPLAGLDSCAVDEDAGLEVRLRGIMGATGSIVLIPDLINPEGAREVIVVRGVHGCARSGDAGPGDACRLDDEPPSEEATEEGVAGRLDTSEGGGLLFSHFLSCRV